MRILLPGPQGPDTFADNVAVTLKAMGHDVIAPPARQPRASDRLRSFAREVAERLGSRVPSAEERWLVRACREHKPDMLLALTRTIGEETLAELKRLGVRRRVAWWGDPPANMRRLGLLTREWDFVFLKDEDAVPKFRMIGIQAALLHEAMNPMWHKPVAECAGEELVVAGNWYAYRQRLVARLIESNVQVGVYGPPLPFWAMSNLRPLHSGRYIVREEKSKIFGRGLACLNSTSFAEGNSLNCRAFEIAGAGGLQLLEYRPIVAECFDPDKELATFRDYAQLLEHIARAKREPAWARKLRTAGAARALTDHTYQKRLSVILEAAERL